jgi:hypothetical protein
LIHLALTGAYRARWSDLVHDEWKRNLLANRSDLTQAQLDRTSALMDKAVPDGLVIGYESLYFCCHARISLLCIGVFSIDDDGEGGY